MQLDVIYPDGSVSTYRRDGGSTHDGPGAINRLRVFAAMQALKVYIKSNGTMELTRGGANMAIRNVIEPITGKTYKRSMNGKREAFEDAISILESIGESVVMLESDDENN